MKFGFIIVSLFLVVALSGTMVVSVDRIFTWLTPLSRKDLFWKAQRGAAELGRTADVGIILRDQQLLHEIVEDYEADEEVRLIIAQDDNNQTLYRHSKGEIEDSELFTGAPQRVQEKDDLLWSWTDVKMEGRQVGRLGLAVSTARLQAGQALRERILQTAIGAGLLAIVLSLLFVNLYVAPLISLTKQAFLELERKTAEALEAARVKGEFLANMSHEIRTPINGVIGMLGLLIRGELSPVQRRRAEISEGSARSLLALINDILDFSKMESGHYVLHAVDCELEQLVRNRMELLALKAHAKQLELAYRFEQDVPHIVHADADRLTQVLTNLVGNAVKFTEEGEVLVTVSAATSPDCKQEEVLLRFEVRDTGPGIAEADQTRLFRSFSQVDASATRAHEGTGLGLAISKHLVGMMNGEIGLTSAVGRGSTFWFTARVPVVQQKAEPMARPGSTQGRSVLLADSSEAGRTVLGEHLVRWGMRVACAASSGQALALAREAAQQQRPFDFALVDLKLQDAKGAPLAEVLRKVSPGLSVIRLTPSLWMPPTDEATEAGLFLAKPVRASELYDCLVTGSMGDPARGPRSRRNTLERRGPRRGHILVVDDNEVNRVLAEELLDELDHTCDLAASGQEAVQQAASRRYDAILMDCQMPGMNGYQATHEIREREGVKRRTPIIALTAHAFTGEVQKVKAAGMDDFLTKPVTPRQLEATLQKWMVAASTGRLRACTRVISHASERRHPSSDAPPQGAEGPCGEQPILDLRKRSPRLIEAFLRNVPDQVSSLVEACAETDLGAIRARAHKLKGSASSIGALRMAKLCEAMQLAAEHGEQEQLSEWARLVAGQLVELLPNLESELQLKQAKP